MRTKVLQFVYRVMKIDDVQGLPSEKVFEVLVRSSEVVDVEHFFTIHHLNDHINH